MGRRGSFADSCYRKPGCFWSITPDQEGSAVFCYAFANRFSRSRCSEAAVRKPPLGCCEPWLKTSSRSSARVAGQSWRSTQDMERFACGYCGTDMIVQRRGGTVVLRLVQEAIKKVQIGTDKTAAELAIVRYERELQELQRSLAVAQKNSDKSVGCVTMIGFGVFFFGVMNVAGDVYHSSSVGGGVVLIFVAAAILFFAYKSEGKSEPSPIKRRIEFVKKQIAEKKRLVDS